ncbi:hypothetical protein LOTGIDRAFT_235330 [Lottia gigantea]|uniref:Protein Jumonji n=1 Tax=Lottia gigantea TaxID=225164 RepID=V3ZQA5_LOTGI|nr:hypothetical protein LOTGIDRAFT_235330 [Lottia gigantea]ESO86517.1 hypothetical protein LOTGIDRAFT_235330 [Lottia gigantea]
MVGKRPCTQGGKKHTPSSPRRPKRNVPVKTIDDTVGLSKKEEKELKKALYASLQETKLKVTYTYEKVIDKRHSGSRHGSQSAPASQTTSRRTSTVTSSSTTTSMDESSQDSVKSYTSTNTTATSTLEPIRAKVHAQRKFAQGSLPVTPSTTPVKTVTSPFKLLPKTPKTEDFITFLCLRGTSVLPPHLDFLKYSGDESNESSKAESNNSCKQPPTLGVKGEEITRESTPESSSASSNDELYQLHTPSPSTRNGGISSALRKAARASASTPETNRGIVSLRQGLSRKASSLAQTPPSSRSRSLLSTPDKSSRSGRKHSSLSSKQRLGVKRLTKSFSNYSPKRKEASIQKSASTSKLGSKKNMFGREKKRRQIKVKSCKCCFARNSEKKSVHFDSVTVIEPSDFSGESGDDRFSDPSIQPLPVDSETEDQEIIFHNISHENDNKGGEKMEYRNPGDNGKKSERNFKVTLLSKLVNDKNEHSVWKTQNDKGLDCQYNLNDSGTLKIDKNLTNPDDLPESLSGFRNFKESNITSSLLDDDNSFQYGISNTESNFTQIKTQNTNNISCDNDLEIITGNLKIKHSDKTDYTNVIENMPAYNNVMSTSQSVRPEETLHKISQLSYSPFSDYGSERNIVTSTITTDVSSINITDGSQPYLPSCDYENGKKRRGPFERSHTLKTGSQENALHISRSCSPFTDNGSGNKFLGTSNITSLCESLSPQSFSVQVTDHSQEPFFLKRRRSQETRMRRRFLAESDCDSSGTSEKIYESLGSISQDLEKLRQASKMNTTEASEDYKENQNSENEVFSYEEFENGLMNISFYDANHCNSPVTDAAISFNSTEDLDISDPEIEFKSPPAQFILTFEKDKSSKSIDELPVERDGYLSPVLPQSESLDIDMSDSAQDSPCMKKASLSRNETEWQLMFKETESGQVKVIDTQIDMDGSVVDDNESIVKDNSCSPVFAGPGCYDLPAFKSRDREIESDVKNTEEEKYYKPIKPNITCNICPIIATAQFTPLPAPPLSIYRSIQNIPLSLPYSTDIGQLSHQVVKGGGYTTKGNSPLNTKTVNKDIRKSEKLKSTSVKKTDELIKEAKDLSSKSNNSQIPGALVSNNSKNLTNVKDVNVKETPKEKSFNNHQYFTRLKKVTTGDDQPLLLLPSPPILSYPILTQDKKSSEPLRKRRMKSEDVDCKRMGGRQSRRSSTSDSLSLSLDSGLRGKRATKSRSESLDSRCSPSRKIPKRRSSSRVKSLTHQRRLQHYESDHEIDDEEVFVLIDDLDSDNKKRGRPKGSKNKKSLGMAMSTRRSVFLQKSAKKLTSAGKLATKRKIAAMNTLKKSSVKEQKKLSNMIEKRRHIKSTSSDTKDNNVRSKSLDQTNKTSRIRNSPSTSKTSPRSTRKTSVSPKRIPPEGRASWRSEILVDIPVYHPTDQEFRDPLTYIESIRSAAEPFGMCKIVPPPSWKPDCRINDDMRFTAQVQYLHRLYKRWGPNVEKTECILKYLQNIGVDFDSIPKIGSVDLDLPKLSQIIQDHGGMQNVIDKKKWIKIADLLNIPKMAVDRGTKLFDAYCKYLLPYDTLSPEEKRKVKQQVLTEKQKKEEMNEIDDGVVKGKSSPLSAFIRIARNVHSMWFKDEPTVEQMESEYWKILDEGKKHVVVQCGHVNTKTQGTAFPTRHDNSYTRHSWNLNNLPQNSKSLLKVLGPITGTTIPTLHIGMLFATSCWSCNPHNLPYIQYLHTGADIVWYAVSKQHESKLKEAMLNLTPDLISEDPQWLKEDVVMIKPELLLEKDVPVGKCIQKPQEFVVIFNKSFTATVSCGYNVSESAHYATTDWLPHGIQAAQDLNGSFERELFSMDALLYNLCTSDSTDKDVLSVAFDYLEKIITEEISLRRQVYDNGLKIFERMAICDDIMMSTYPRKRQQDLLECDENICDISKKICYLSMVINDVEKTTLCLKEALQHLGKKKNLKSWRLLYRYTDEELKQVLENTKKKLNDTPSKRRISRKFE